MTDLREQQRVAHLVLGQPRPVPEIPKKPAGMSKAQWKVRRAALMQMRGRLEPGVEEAVALRETWRGIAGTPETLERASRCQAGALARLHRTGALTANQLAAAEEIKTAVEQLRSDVDLPIASWETRVDAGYRPDLAGKESVRSIALQRAYSWWRAGVAGPVQMLLDVIVDDWPYTEAAARYRVGDRRAKRLLVDALDYWWACRKKR